MKALITGALEMQGNVYKIECYNWYAFLLRINEIMRKFEVEFPVGEDDKMRMVRLPHAKIEKWSNKPKGEKKS